MKKFAYTAATFFLPVVAFAAVNDSLQDLGATIIGLINNLAVPLIFALAFLVFIWGVFQYFILGGSDAEKRDQGKGLMIWGIIGFFVMVSVWGLVNLLTGTVDLNNNAPGRGSDTPLPQAPTVRTGSN